MIYFRLPMIINRYEVYKKDIAPLGFDFVEIDEKITDKAVNACIEAIVDPVRKRKMVEWNFQLARNHFSYEAVTPVIKHLIETI